MLFSRQRNLPFSQQSLAQALDVQPTPQAAARVRRSPAVARAEAPAPSPESVVVQKVSGGAQAVVGRKVRPGQRVTGAELAAGSNAPAAQGARAVERLQTESNTARTTSLLPSSAGSDARVTGGRKTLGNNVLGAAAPKVLRLDTEVRRGGRAPSAAAPVLTLLRAAPALQASTQLAPKQLAPTQLAQKANAKPALVTAGKASADGAVAGGEQAAPLSTRKRIEQAAELFGACMLIAAALLLTLFG